MVHDVVCGAVGNYCGLLLGGGDDMDRKEKRQVAAQKKLSVYTTLQLARVWEAQAQLRDRCDCGHKVRGPDHLEGTHHKMRHPSIRRAK